MKPDFSSEPPHDLEARVTALLLGELTGAEAASLRQAIEADPDLAELHDRLKQTIGLVREVSADPTEPAASQSTPLKLSSDRREKLLAQFKTVKPKEFEMAKLASRKVPYRIVELAAALILLGMLAGFLLPGLAKSKSKSQSAQILANLRQLDGAKQEWITENKAVSSREPTFKDIEPYMGRGSGELPKSIAGETYMLGKVGESPIAVVDPNTARKLFAVTNSVPLKFGTWGPSNLKMPVVSPAPPISIDVDGKAVLAEHNRETLGRMAEGRGDLSGINKRKPYAPSTEAQAQLVGKPATSPTEIASRGEQPKIYLPTQDAQNASDGAVEAKVFQLKNADAGQVAEGLKSFYAQNNAGIGRSGGAGGGSFGGSPSSKPVEVAKSSPSGTAVSGGLPVGEPELGGKLQNPQPISNPALTEVVQSRRGFSLLGPKEAIDENKSSDNASATYKLYDLNTPPAVAVSGGTHGLDEQSNVSSKADKFAWQLDAADSSDKLAFGLNKQTFAYGESRQGTVSEAPALTLQSNNSFGLATTAGEVPTHNFGGIDGLNNGVALADGSVQQYSQSGLKRALNGTDSSLTNVLLFPGDEAAPIGALNGPPAVNEFAIKQGNVALRAPSSNPTIALELSEPTKPLKQSLAEPGKADGYNLDVVTIVTNSVEQFDAKPWNSSPAEERLLRLPKLGSEARIATKVQDGKFLYEAGRLDEAEAKFKEAYKKDPSNTAANQYLHMVAQRRIADAERQAELQADNSLANVEKAWKKDPTDGTNAVQQLAYAPSSPTLQIASEEAIRRQADTLTYRKEIEELEQLKKKRDILALQTSAEGVEPMVPKSTMVTVIEHAEAGDAPAQSFLGRVGNALTGTVERRARVKVGKDVNDVAGVSGAQVSNGVYDPHFVQTEFEVIQSDVVLDKAVKKLNLEHAWAETTSGKDLNAAEARQLLRRRLDLQPSRNGSLVDIGAKDKDPKEAARIANAVAEAYSEYHAEKRRELVLAGIKQFTDQLTQQDAAVHEKEAQLNDLRRKMGLAETESQKPVQLANIEKTDVPIKKFSQPAPEPQPEVLTSTNAFSTFSLNIADVSFKLAAASLEKGVMPEPASIRSEEFINAFDYRDPEAVPGVPIAFAWERARYPFAQNRDLLRFSLKTAASGRAAGRPLNIVLLLDNSGSMERADRVAIVREALRVLASQLQPQDVLSIVTFARTAQLVADGVPGNQAGAAVEKVSGLTPQGGTNLEDAMKLAYETALRHYFANGSGVNRVVLLTDGAANLGNVDPTALKQKVEAQRKQGIALDCFGIGWEDFNDDLLEVLARNGDGRYGFLNSPEEAATGFAHQLAGALNVAASDVKVQVEFNPSRVTVYRQIGYAKLQLTKEQFRDNTVDAAEIAAQEAGNALYVLEVNPNGSGPLGTVRVRYKVPGTQEFHEHEWAVLYTGDALAMDQSSPAMRLATTASAFSEWLANSPYATEVSPDALLRQFSGVPEIYGADERPKKLEWMLRQAKSISGK